jgi:hypothetical protein
VKEEEELKKEAEEEENPLTFNDFKKRFEVSELANFR